MSLNREQIYETTVSLFIVQKNMGLAARGAKILPTQGMSWHWQIVKCTHYEKDGGKTREKKILRHIASSLQHNRETQSSSHGNHEFEFHLATCLLNQHSFLQLCFLYLLHSTCPDPLFKQDWSLLNRQTSLKNCFKSPICDTTQHLIGYLTVTCQSAAT